MIVLPRAPVQSLSSIGYYDSNGTLQTLSASQYTVTWRASQGESLPPTASTWPTTRTRTNAVIVTYIAGWTTAALVPANVKHLIKLWISHFYENREPVNIGNIVNEIPLSLSTLTTSCKWTSNI
jgi:uncharacterized phiE125 gp8 family phage protein